MFKSVYYVGMNIFDLDCSVLCLLGFDVFDFQVDVDFEEDEVIIVMLDVEFLVLWFVVFCCQVEVFKGEFGLVRVFMLGWMICFYGLVVDSCCLVNEVVGLIYDVIVELCGNGCMCVDVYVCCDQVVYFCVVCGVGGCLLGGFLCGGGLGGGLCLGGILFGGLCGGGFCWIGFLIGVGGVVGGWLGCGICVMVCDLVWMCVWVLRICMYGIFVE